MKELICSKSLNLNLKKGETLNLYYKHPDGREWINEEVYKHLKDDSLYCTKVDVYLFENEFGYKNGLCVVLGSGE